MTRTQAIDDPGRPWRAAIVPVLAGAAALVAGYLIARQASAPGELSTLVYVWIVPIGLVSFLLAVSGFIGRGRDENPAAAPTQALASGLALAVGVAVGVVATPILGLTYAAPVLYRAAGPANLDLAAPVGFEAASPAKAECRSVPDRPTIEQVSIDDAGLLEGGRVVAVVIPNPTGATTDTISLELGGETGRTILWHGPSRIELLGPDGRSGRATFTGLVGEDPGLKVGPGNSPAPIDPYPATLSGTITWSCGPWQAGVQPR